MAGRYAAKLTALRATDSKHDSRLQELGYLPKVQVLEMGYHDKENFGEVSGLSCLTSLLIIISTRPFGSEK